MSLRYRHTRVALLVGALAFAAAFTTHTVRAVPPDEAIAPVRQQLDKEIRLQLLQVPLDRALEFLLKETGLPYVIDRASLRSKLNTTVELTVEKITIRDALELAFAQIGWDYIDYDVRNGRLFVSTPANVIKPHLQTHVYDVRALTMHAVNFTEEPQVGLIDAINGGGRNDDSGGSLFSQSDDDHADISGTGALDDLIRLSIRNGTHDGNWEVPGVTMQQRNGLLIVVNTAEVHAEINDLLTKYQAASGKMISVNARFLLVRTDALDAFIAQQTKDTLVLNPQQVNQFRATVGAAAQGARLLGTARTVCFNSQRVYVAAGNEQEFVSDLDPVVGTRSAAFDPQVSTLANMSVLSVETTAGVDNKTISTTIRGGLAIGNGIRVRGRLALKGEVDNRGDDTPDATPDNGNDGGDDSRDGDALPADNTDAEQTEPASLPAQKLHEVFRVDRLDDEEMTSRNEGNVPIDNTVIELPEQDSVQFRTSARIPNGGGVILAGSSTLYRYFEAPEGTEIVLLIQASAVE
ncbi:MAG: hypothetical protein GC159_09105 [Phycisphaera sp.]|nr:hypothetical protein [Phycisphaera sp.]